MAGIVVDTSVLIGYFAGDPAQLLKEAAVHGGLILPPLVVAEAFSGDMLPNERFALGELLQEAPVHGTPLGHWLDVGNLRRSLRRKGVNVSLPDAHIAQCALELDAVLFTRDAVFTYIAQHTALRVTSAAS